MGDKYIQKVAELIQKTPLTVEMIEGAKKTESLYNIPTSITLAQILQESTKGSGLSGLASAPNYNLFGIKAFSSWTGETVTLRNGAGDPNKYSTYRKYNNYEESIIDHAKVLSNDRYTKYTSTATTLEEYAQGIQKGGYAEDVNYANSLISIIKKYGLDSLDGKTSGLNNWTSFPGMNYTPSENSEGIAKQTVSFDSMTTMQKLEYIGGEVFHYVFIILIFVFAVVFFMKAFDIKAPKKKIIENVTGEGDE